MDTGGQKGTKEKKKIKMFNGHRRQKNPKGSKDARRQRTPVKHAKCCPKKGILLSKEI
jgi:hypothetical protein